jgi:hypothetical protein
VLLGECEHLDAEFRHEQRGERVRDEPLGDADDRQAADGETDAEPRRAAGPVRLARPEVLADDRLGGLLEADGGDGRDGGHAGADQVGGEAGPARGGEDDDHDDTDRLTGELLDEQRRGQHQQRPQQWPLGDVLACEFED